MSENPEGTPNPLNPAPEDVASAPETGEEMVVGTGALDFTETEIPSDDEPVSDISSSAESTANNTANTVDTAGVAAAKDTVKPASFAQTAGENNAGTSIPISEPAEATTEPASAEPKISTEPTTSDMPEMAKPEPVSAMPEIPVAKPNTSQSVVDPMMKPVARKESDFGSLSSSETPADTASEAMPGIGGTPISNSPASAAPVSATAAMSAEPELVAKDSVVEPAGGKSGKKKAFIICAIVLVIIAILCGAAAIAIAVLNNNGDKVSRAIDRLINRETSSIVTVEGNITTMSNNDDSAVYVDIDGTFDTRSTMNKVSASINPVFSNGQEFTIEVDEIENQSGDVFVKLSGLTGIFSSAQSTMNTLMTGGATDVTYTIEATDDDDDEAATVESVDTVTYTNCANGASSTNCVSSVSQYSAVQSMLSMYAGLFEVVDDEWILVSSNFVENVMDSSFFDNNTTCLINAFGTLPEYGKDIANKYKASPFITYSTDKLTIAKKKDTLYRLGFDEDKLTAFINSMSNSGFVNELNACAGNTAINADAVTSTIKEIFAGFPTVYAEVSDNYDFTRLYFEVNTNTDDTEQTIAADLSFSYPSELKIEEPASYIEMSELLNTVMSGALFSGSNVTIYNNY